MSSRAVFLVLACFLLINTRVSSEWEEEILVENGAHAPVASSIYERRPPPPPICPPPPPVAKAPSSPPPPAKASPPPPVKASSSPPPPLKTSPPPPVKASPPPPVEAPAPPVKPPTTRQDCTPLCVVRCKNHSRKNICLRACLTCCERCKCVPPGQYGNKEKCGKCYTDMTTRGGRLKCP